MMPTWQRSLFELGEEISLAPLDTSLARTELGDGAWLEVRPHWLARHDLLFDQLVEDVPWQAERRTMYDRVVDVPRMVAFYQEGESLPHPVLAEMKRRLNLHYGTTGETLLRTTSVCLYRNGQDSVAWHGDRIRLHSDQTLVAIASLGQRRRFLLRPAHGGPAARFDLGEGDLLVMGGTCQSTWEHSVPKTSRPVGPRISIQFRSAGAA